MNKKIRKLAKMIYRKIYVPIISCLPGNDRYIFFESGLDLSDNPKAVFDEMIFREFNKKYKLVWKVSDCSKEFPLIDNVIYIDNKSLTNTLRLYWYVIKARCLIFGNSLYPTVRKGQTSIYLSHGTPIKDLKGCIELPASVDCFTAAGEDIIPFLAEAFSYPQNQIVATGFPRNDVFSKRKIDLKNLFPQNKFNKVIVWYPTFRQHKVDLRNSAKNAIPIIHNEENAFSLNESAKKNDVLIVLKPHFGQNTDYIKQMKLSNILFIDDKFYAEHKISSYEFVGSCDALITDYSSIYYDYMLCDKPIALIWEDYEEYKKNQGFANGVEQYLDGGEKIYTIDELKEFVIDVANDVDKLREQRNIICTKVNISNDGMNSKRVTDFIVEKANL